MFMREETRTVLHILRDAEWFAHVGEPVANPAIARVSSWQAAMDSCASLKWENDQLEASNLLHYWLRVTAPEARNRWNAIVGEVKLDFDPIIKSKLRLIVTALALPDAVFYTVRWDMLYILMAAEYAHLVSVDYYAELALWYVKGYFPCGWAGEFPEGNFIVF